MDCRGLRISLKKHIIRRGGKENKKEKKESLRGPGKKYNIDVTKSWVNMKTRKRRTA